MKPTPSLYEVRPGLVIDLDEIAWIETIEGRIRLKGSTSLLDVSRQYAKETLEVWIAFKGRFDPTKER